VEQEARERYWLISWAGKWRAVRDRAAVALGDRVGDVTQQVCLEVEVEEEVAYGEYVGDEGEADDDLLD
jgi:co-chaperonin GroES (HSP10)